MNPRYKPLLATAVIFAIAYILCVLQYPAMWSTRVFGNFLTDNAFLGIAAVGMTFVILSGGIDLSIGSVIAFTGVFLAVMMENTAIHPLAAFVLVLIITTSFGALMGGAIVTERIFNINGIGFFIYRSITQRDGTSVVGAVVCLVIVYLVVNLIVDILYGVLDPRISHD